MGNNSTAGVELDRKSEELNRHVPFNEDEHENINETTVVKNNSVQDGDFHERPLQRGNSRFDENSQTPSNAAANDTNEEEKKAET